VRPDAQNQQLHKEKLLYAFEISRNALGQPTISTVRRGYRNIGWEPSECNNPYVNCPQEVQNLTGGTNAYPHSWPPGLVRRTTGQGCNVEASDMLSHCISVNKRPGAGNGYEAWIWWYYYINTTTLPANTNRLRIFGYRIDSNTISDRWVVLQPTVNRPDSVTRQATMDACFDQVGGKIWFQISTVEGTVDDPGRAIVTAGWLPSDFAGQLDESDFYTPDRMDFSATACVPFGDEILLDEDMFYGHLSPGTIDAPWHSGSQGRVSGVYRDGALITTYRITNGSLSMPPTSIHYGLSDVPDITSFGNPFATSQYGRSGNIPQNNPHGAAISAQYYDDNNPNICTSLWENSENENARNYVTKGVLLSNDQFGITEVNLTQNNHSVKVSQVRKRLDQSGSSTSRDRELFYTWMGKNGSGNPVLAIKRSSNLAFRYGYNQSSEFYQWIEFAPGAPALGQTFGNSLFCGINHWGNGRYNHGALAGFLEWNLPAYSSGDQLFNSIYEARVTAAHDSLNNRNLLTGNELSQFGNVVLGLLQNPTDPNDPAADGSYYFFFQGQTGTISRDISDSWNFFKLRPWGYNYFRYSVPEDFSGEDGGAAIQSDAKIWSYWIDWQ